MSINDKIKCEDIRDEFKRIISWNKYRFEITTQPRNINRLFVLSFRNGDNDPTKNYCDRYYMPVAEIKDFNVLTDKKPISDQPLKNKQEVYKKPVEMSRNDDYTIWNLLDYLYYHKYYKTHWHRYVSTNKYEYSSTN